MLFIYFGTKCIANYVIITKQQLSSYLCDALSKLIFTGARHLRDE
jgi:hypothetical protein